MLSSISLLNKIIQGNFDVFKTVNLLYQSGSLSKDIQSALYLHVFFHILLIHFARISGNSEQKNILQIIEQLIQFS